MLTSDCGRSRCGLQSVLPRVLRATARERPDGDDPFLPPKCVATAEKLSSPRGCGADSLAVENPQPPENLGSWSDSGRTPTPAGPRCRRPTIGPPLRRAGRLWGPPSPAIARVRLAVVSNRVRSKAGAEPAPTKQPGLRELNPAQVVAGAGDFRRGRRPSARRGRAIEPRARSLR